MLKLDDAHIPKAAAQITTVLTTDFNPRVSAQIGEILNAAFLYYKNSTLPYNSTYLESTLASGGSGVRVELFRATASLTALTEPRECYHHYPRLI